MSIPVTRQTFLIAGKPYQLCAPDEALLRKHYVAQQALDADAPFPFWGKVWPAAIALSRFIAQNSAVVAGKMVLELAAGLGLPSIVAAQHAQKIVCTDKDEQATACVRQSILWNRLNNISTAVMDWNQLSFDTAFDVVLMSDVAYDPAAFETLQHVVETFLNKGATVLFSTPQRLMAKPVVAGLSPYCVQTEVLTADDVPVSVMVLKKGVL